MLVNSEFTLEPEPGHFSPAPAPAKKLRLHSPVCAKSSTPSKSGERRKLRGQEDQLHKMVNQAKEVNITRSTREKKGTNKKEELNYSVNTLSLQEVIDRVAAPRTRSFSTSDAKRRDIMGNPTAGPWVKSEGQLNDFPQHPSYSQKSKIIKHFSVMGCILKINDKH